MLEVTQMLEEAIVKHAIPLSRIVMINDNNGFATIVYFTGNGLAELQTLQSYEQLKLDYQRCSTVEQVE